MRDYPGRVKLLLLVIMIAVVVYLVVRLVVGRLDAQDSQTRRTVAPDDDEEFLRDLDRKRRHPEDPDPT